MSHRQATKGREERASCYLFSTGDSKDGRRFFFNLKGTLFRPTVGSPGRLSPQRHSWRRKLLHRNSHSLQKEENQGTGLAVGEAGGSQSWWGVCSRTLLLPCWQHCLGLLPVSGRHQLWECKPKDTQDDECDEGVLEARSNTSMLSATLTVNHSFPAQDPSVLDGAPSE